MPPVLYMIVPCFNESEVLPLTAPEFSALLDKMAAEGLISDTSKVMFVDDGSRDDTWEIIKCLSRENPRFTGISQSRNRGHQNAVWAGLMEAADKCDITVSVDCDGQDDISAAEEMVREYLSGSEIVYGVRADRESDTVFKRFTAEAFYKFMSFMGAETVFNHADYRLLSSRAVKELARFEERNLFLRGLIPLVGFKSSCVYYKRSKRRAGKGHYPLRKMLNLALDGITSLSVKPLRMICALGLIISLLSFAGVIWAVLSALTGGTVSGWASTVCIICFVGGIQLVCLGVIGEYIGKIYTEVKRRPRYIISERTEDIFDGCGRDK